MTNTVQVGISAAGKPKTKSTDETGAEATTTATQSREAAPTNQSESLEEEELLDPPRLRERWWSLCFLWPWWLPAYRPPRPAAEPAYAEP